MSDATLTSALADLLSGALDDDLRTLNDWAAMLPGRRRARGMSGRVLLRWALAGVRGHRLPTRRVGLRHVVSGRDLREHLERIAPRASRAAPRPSPRRLSQRRARRAAIAERAAREALR